MKPKYTSGVDIDILYLGRSGEEDGLCLISITPPPLPLNRENLAYSTHFVPSKNDTE
jgi:hypothetical protein